jgi:hypothetical protein
METPYLVLGKEYCIGKLSRRQRIKKARKLSEWRVFFPIVSPQWSQYGTYGLGLMTIFLITKLAETLHQNVGNFKVQDIGKKKIHVIIS